LLLLIWDLSLKKKQGLKAYFECSALTQVNVSTIFEACAKCILGGVIEGQDDDEPDPEPVVQPVQQQSSGRRCQIQ